MSQGWIELFRTAISAEAPRPVVLALATIDHSGHPQVRSVILRRLDDAGAIWMTSDSRSAKIAELSANPHAAASCWLSESRRQFRLNGRVEICTQEVERKKLWADLRPETRATFFCPEPGLPKAADSSFLAASDQSLPPKIFAVLVFRPALVELLELTPHPHCRRRWTMRESWDIEELNP